MKTIWIFIVLVSFINFGCSKNDDEIVNMDVEQYIELLKTNRYDSINLPAFTEKDIPALLKYRFETTNITKFPRNPISSYYEQECRLGMYVLWTIESIRSVSVKSKQLIMRFPSQNPFFARRDTEEWAMDDVTQAIAANAYYNWWKNNMFKNFEEYKNIDPLENTIYRWK